MPDSIQNLYDNILQKESYHLMPDPVMKLDVKFEDGGAEPHDGHMASLAEVMKYEFDKDAPFQVEVTCTSTAVAYSYFDPGDKTKINNYVMLTHDVSFMPIGLTTKHFGVSEYRVRIKPLTNASASSPRRSHFMRHEPTQTDTLTHFSRSVSHGVTLGIGFFGDVPTGNVDFNSNVSKTIDMAEPSVRCDDHSNAEETYHSFILNDPVAAKTTHQFQLIQLASIPDDGLKPERDQHKADAQKLQFSLEFEAISKLDSVRYNAVSKHHPTSAVKKHPGQTFSIAAPPHPKTDDEARKLFGVKK
ncbi:hypothetical protein MD484_g303, partial [Candolleomyces efflorescens]